MDELGLSYVKVGKNKMSLRKNDKREWLDVPVMKTSIYHTI